MHAYSRNITGPLRAALDSTPTLTADEERALTRGLRDAHLAAWQAALIGGTRASRRAVLLSEGLAMAGLLGRWPAEHADLLASLPLPHTTRAVAVLRTFDHDLHTLRAVQSLALDDCDDARTSPRASASTARRAEQAHRAVLATQATLARLEDRMLRHNLGLVMSVVRRYAESRAIGHADLVQQGSLGLLHALRTFDPDRGLRFSTMAMEWVRDAVSRYVANHRHTVRVPVHVHTKARALARLSPEELAAVDPSTAHHNSRHVLATAVALAHTPELTASMDAPVKSMGRDGGGKKPDQRTLGETFPDLAPVADDRLAADQATYAVQRAVATLRPQTAEIVRRVAGLHDSEPQSVVAIAAAMGLTRRAVGDLYTKAVDCLRRYPDMRAVGC